ncbi:MAG: SpoIIE family protein phosphatase [Lachnospiraceae bacterium]|nr:SpoIIE family protein phosphatase [Lachnospiraceae bacterium]
MRKKILRVIILIMAVMLVCLCIMLYVQMQMMQKSLVKGNEDAGSRVEELSTSAMSEQTRQMLLDSSANRASLADDEFAEFKSDVCVLADSAVDIYKNINNYGEARLDRYDNSYMGKLITYAAYGDGVDPESEAIKSELSKIANLRGTMQSIVTRRSTMASDYIATKTGIFLGTETASEYNIPKDGEELSFEARKRPWYTEAEESKEPVFTGMIKDIDTGAYAITCGAPIYLGNSFKGVAGAGMYLDTIRDDIDGFRVGKGGYALIINDRGQILFSGADGGELAAMENEGEDLRNSSNKELAKLADMALGGSADVNLVNVDGASYYIAYAPMETVGWSYFVVLPESEVLNPTRELIASLNAGNIEENNFVRRSIFSSIIGMLVFALVLGFVAAVISRVLANRLAAPIVRLTDRVHSIEGDNLDFEWSEDTGDEVQTLADSFGSMTVRMKQYIKDITEITAEKERIGAELSVATHIQASMLPCIFPPFPERKEFDLYAKMDPAKEVGGDFYDFFFVDDHHIALVIADVSGKGIPAALFMVIAKTLIKNHAQAGEEVEQVFINSNDQLCEGNGEELFVTAWLGIIDLRTGVMRFSDAGHENPYILHGDGSVELLKPAKKKMPLAAMEGMAYLANEVTLAPADLIFLYTDGVPEATNASNELYTTDRLETVLKEHINDDPESLLLNVRKNVDEFVNEAPQFDDLTMLAFRLKELEDASFKGADE